jgi:hypothetical protein
MVIAEIRRERAAERAYPKHEDVVQALAPNRPDKPFDVGSLPGRAWSGKNLLDAHHFHLLDEVLPEDAIPVA